MSLCNDGWYMNESLAFYLSTNTFTNPIFSAEVQENETNERQSFENRENLHRYDSQARPKRKVWKKFRDNIKFTIRAKIFVLELNFKQSLKSVKKFSDTHLPKWTIFKKRIFVEKSQPTTRNPTTTCPMYARNENFWDTNMKLNSIESLDKQQEKILFRLEQVIRAKRNSQLLFNMADNMSSKPIKRSTSKSSLGIPMASCKQSVGSPVSYPWLSAYKDHSYGDYTSDSNPVSEEQPMHGNSRVPLKRMKFQFSSRNKWNSGKGLLKENSNDDANNSSKKLCIVCYTKSPNIVTLPCKHHEICSDCFLEIIYQAVKYSQYPLKCVLCRQKVEKIRCSRKLLLGVIEKNRRL